MKLDFRGCEAKLLRANEHRLLLQGELEEFFSSESLGYRVSFDEHGQSFLVHAQLANDGSYRWATMVGDIVHNLRSALDHLVAQLVLLNDGSPSHQHQFPICETAQNFEVEIERKRRLEGVSAEHQEFIRRVQPFSWAEEHEWPANIQGLAQLRALSNLDKHQLLLPVRLLPKEFRFAIDFEDAEYVEAWTTEEPIEHEGLVMTARVRPTGPAPRWEPDLSLGGFLALDVPGLPAHNKPVIELFEMVIRAVDGVLEGFRHDFAQEELARSVGLADWLR
jgi:hypothetical protein